MDSQSQQIISSKISELNYYISTKDERNAQRVLHEFIELHPPCRVTINHKSNPSPIDEKIKAYIKILNQPESLVKINKEIYQKLLKAGNSEEDSLLGSTGTTNMSEAIQKIKQKYSSK